MTVRKSALKGTSKRTLAKVDDENPEWMARDFSRAVPHIGGKPVSKAEFRAAVVKAIGRPRSENPKKGISLRLDPDVVEFYRSKGPGWQSRINDDLRRAAHLSKRRA
jgi:uncharacterized protein (DUF4415 family)